LKIKLEEGFPETMVTIQCIKITDEIRNIESMLLNSGKKFRCTKNYETHLLNKWDILYFESVDKQCFLYTDTEVYETNLKLYELEEILGDDGFFRNAKSQIVNITKITSIRPDFGGRIEVVMENGERTIISRQYAKQFKERIGL